CRPADLTSRYGGDEFVVLLPETGPVGAGSVANKVQAAIRLLDLPNPGSPVSRKMTVSQGIATAWPAKKGSSGGLMLAVDRALYDAKQKGRDRISVASSAGLPGHREEVSSGRAEIG